MRWREAPHEGAARHADRIGFAVGAALARMIDELTAANGMRIIPRGVRLTNVNFAVPYEEIQGVDSPPRWRPQRGFPVYTRE